METPVVETDMEAPGAAALLTAKEDHYGGVIIDPDSLPSSVPEFTSALHRSLDRWRQEGKKGIWLQVPTSKVALVAPAVEQGGFTYHHAERDYLMLTQWLHAEPCTLPPNASHQVGVGAFVVNERREVLMVQERNGPLKGKQVWKMPTGLVSVGEDLHEAAEREVWEETGIRGRFAAVLAVRQAHALAFGKSDLFFVCALTVEPGQAQISIQESEIEAAAWIPWDQFLREAPFKGVAMYDRIAEQCVAWAEGRYSGLAGARLESGWVRRRQDLLLWGNAVGSSVGSMEASQDGDEAATAGAP